MYKKICFTICIFAVCAVFPAGCAKRDTLLVQTAASGREAPVEETQTSAGEGSSADAGEAERRAGESGADVGAALEPSGFCYVHICGEVAQPGVYKVERDVRLYQVIELAGGLTAAACPDYINQAAAVEDGMKIVVPSLAEAQTLPIQGEDGGALYGTSGSGRNDSNALVNINTATKEELCALPGVGESRAHSIIDYRTEHGGFSCIEDIMKVEGIKDGAFAKLKEKITVR